MKRTMFLAAGAATILSACGGGGGNPGTTGPAPVQTATLTPITAANSTSVASNAYDATVAISESSTELTGLLTGVSVTGARISTVSPVLTLVRRAARAPQLLAGVTTSESCAGGGTVTIDATIRNQNVISNGDSMTLTARNCIEDGTILDGAMSITFSNMSGDILNSWVYGATMDTRFSNFNIASGGDKIGVNGDMKLVVNQSSASAGSASISGKSLQLNEQQSGAAALNAILTDYAMTGSTQGATTSSAASFTLSGSSAGLGQFAYTVKNVQPFVTSGSAMPGSGALIVDGAASSVTATVVANGMRLDYSAKGDGVITQTNTLGWTEFLSAI